MFVKDFSCAVGLQEKIHIVRGRAVILDEDLAFLYQVSLAELRKQLFDHSSRFPDSFMFQLSPEECRSL